MIRGTIVALTMIIVAVIATPGRTADPATVAGFMRLKLAHSERLLEGIVLADFKLIEKSAQDLSVQTRDEMWQVFPTPEYLQHSLDFRRAADQVGAAARKQNIDGAALAYVGLTLQCVSCHKHVRDVRMAGRNDAVPVKLGNR